MSIVWFNSDGWILCHSTYLYEIYQCLDDNRICTDCGKYGIFHIRRPFLKKGQSYEENFVISKEILEQINLSDESIEVIHVEEKFKKMINEAEQEGINYFTRSCHRIQLENDNSTALNAAQNIVENDDLKLKKFDGGNINQYSICVPFQGIDYFIPGQCRFFSCHIEQLQEKIGQQISNKFDVILLDPPWWNKHIRRKNVQASKSGYKMMYNADLLKIPINSLLSDDGLVIVWCTNSRQHINCLIGEIFPVWNVEYLCSWYWLKVTEDGKPICQFTLEPGKKKPFERIIFASRANRCQKFRIPEEGKLIISVPSGIHSHKPPLTKLLSNYIPDDAHCLEIFARYLLPNWTSTGNEVLKLQQKVLFAP